MTEPALSIHVERTTSAETLRWVCHRPDLDATPVPPDDSDLATMLSDGDIESVAVHHGDLLIRFRHNGDPDKLAAVHRAVIGALRYGQWTAYLGLTTVTIRARDARPAQRSSRGTPADGSHSPRLSSDVRRIPFTSS